MTDEILATILLDAYKASTQDQCRMRYIDKTGNILLGKYLYNIQKQEIIACVHAIVP